MFREDYERFIREFHSDRPEIRLLSFETDPDYNRPFAKVSNENTIFIENAANTNSYIGGVRNIWVLAEGKQKHLTTINLFGATANIVLNAILIPVWGA